MPSFETRQKIDKLQLRLPGKLGAVRAVRTGLCDVCLGQHAVSEADFKFIVHAVGVYNPSVNFLAAGGTVARAVGEELDGFSDRREVEAHDVVQSREVEGLIQDKREVVAIGSPGRSVPADGDTIRR